MGLWANLFHNNIIITYDLCQASFYFDTPAFFALKIHHFLSKLIFYIDVAHSIVHAIMNSSSRTSLPLSKSHHKLLRCTTQCFVIEEHKFSICLVVPAHRDKILGMTRRNSLIFK
jgi:hypothetical protein